MNKIRKELSTALVKVLRREVVPIYSEIVTSRFLLAEITLEYFTIWNVICLSRVHGFIKLSFNKTIMKELPHYMNEAL